MDDFLPTTNDGHIAVNIRKCHKILAFSLNIGMFFCPDNKFMTLPPDSSQMCNSFDVAQTNIRVSGWVVLIKFISLYFVLVIIADKVISP